MMQGNQNGSRGKRSAFSMIELIVVMAILGIVIAVSLPALSQAREAARRTRCLNNLRNITFGLTQYDHFQDRLPAAGYYHDPPNGDGGPHHSWAVSILPHVDQSNLHERWDLDKPLGDAANSSLARSFIPIYSCPDDVSTSQGGHGDLSYVVNGGFGFTIRTGDGIGDCAVDWQGHRLDLNGDEAACTGDAALDALDQKRFEQTGLFFLENWREGETKRSHSIADILDGTSQTFLVSENVRTGYDPNDPSASFANPDPYRTSFYVGNPCNSGRCTDGQIDYARSNSGVSRINSGLWSAEGNSPVPNSFHPGGVNMAYADGHLKFLSEEVDGAVYAALASPQGLMLASTPLKQVIISSTDF